MPFRDDDDLKEPLSSSREALEGSAKLQQRKMEVKKQKEHKKELQKLKLDLLKREVHPNVPPREEGAKQEQHAGTKTREQEAKQSVDTAQTKPDPEEMIQKEKQEAEAQRQAAYEQGKDQTA
ncbi:MAG: hypothetical protein WCS85_03920 [Candidatus Peribacteraceae bacterium]